MKKSLHTEEQIIGILKQRRAGLNTADLCREHGICEATFYNWKSKYGDKNGSEARSLQEMEDENHQLKLLVADLILDRDALIEVIGKNGLSWHRMVTK